jgi:hypothetical protein
MTIYVHYHCHKELLSQLNKRRKTETDEVQKVSESILVTYEVGGTMGVVK